MMRRSEKQKRRHANTTQHSPSNRKYLSPEVQIKEAIFKAAKDQNTKEKFNLVSKKRVMENFSITSPEHDSQKKEFVVLTPDRWSSNGWKYTTIKEKSTQYFNHPFKKNCTGYTNINMTATKDGRLRKDHFKSTYSNSFCQDFEELKRQLSPLPRIIAGKTQYTPREHKGHHQRGFSDYTPKKLDQSFKRKGVDSHQRNNLTQAGALHMHHDRHHKQYRVTMNNDGVPLRNLTLGGMVGGKTAENNFDVWAGQPIMKGRGVSQIQPFNRKKTFMTKWERASFNGGVF